ncbi:hypothetical protein CYMTET_44761 [Cymbomonas tetramitiformis]|uniref:JmjC domain-containing protein n=1 Tax=Cymbomonas tetramitiformis TaxID=36881 RepID=A0AAE0BZJ8_9CHLO|nr:hypothetical protein CYMTET_44761 [Cymbomonas tetramitiformis]
MSSKAPAAVRETALAVVTTSPQAGASITAGADARMAVAGCYSDVCFVPAGHSMWFHMARGSEVYYLGPPSTRNMAAFRTWSKFQGSSSFLAHLIPDIHRRELTDGDTLFIPDGWLYAVATVDDSIVLGGSFAVRPGGKDEQAVRLEAEVPAAVAQAPPTTVSPHVDAAYNRVLAVPAMAAVSLEKSAGDAARLPMEWEPSCRKPQAMSEEAAEAGSATAGLRAHAENPVPQARTTSVPAARSPRPAPSLKEQAQSAVCKHHTSAAHVGHLRALGSTKKGPLAPGSKRKLHDANPSSEASQSVKRAANTKHRMGWRHLSPKLQAFLQQIGHPAEMLSWPLLMQRVLDYIKHHALTSSRGNVCCDQALERLFGRLFLTSEELGSLLRPHISTKPFSAPGGASLGPHPRQPADTLSPPCPHRTPIESSVGTEGTPPLGVIGAPEAVWRPPASMRSGTLFAARAPASGPFHTAGAVEEGRPDTAALADLAMSLIAPGGLDGTAHLDLPAALLALTPASGSESAAVATDSSRPNAQHPPHGGIPVSHVSSGALLGLEPHLLSPTGPDGVAHPDHPEAVGGSKAPPPAQWQRQQYQERQLATQGFVMEDDGAKLDDWKGLDRDAGSRERLQCKAPTDAVAVHGGRSEVALSEGRVPASQMANAAAMIREALEICAKMPKPLPPPPHGAEQAAALSTQRRAPQLLRTPQQNHDAGGHQREPQQLQEQAREKPLLQGQREPLQQTAWEHQARHEERLLQQLQQERRLQLQGPQGQPGLHLQQPPALQGQLQARAQLHPEGGQPLEARAQLHPEGPQIGRPVQLPVSDPCQIQQHHLQREQRMQHRSQPHALDAETQHVVSTQVQQQQQQQQQQQPQQQQQVQLQQQQRVQLQQQQQQIQQQQEEEVQQRQRQRQHQRQQEQEQEQQQVRLHQQQHAQPPQEQQHQKEVQRQQRQQRLQQQVQLEQQHQQQLQQQQLQQQQLQLQLHLQLQQQQPHQLLLLPQHQVHHLLHQHKAPLQPSPHAVVAMDTILAPPAQRCYSPLPLNTTKSSDTSHGATRSARHRAAKNTAEQLAREAAVRSHIPSRNTQDEAERLPIADYHRRDKSRWMVTEG